MNLKNLSNIKSYIEKLVSSHEQKSSFTVEALLNCKSNLSIYLISFDTISSTHIFAEKYDINEIPDNSVILFNSEHQFNSIGQRSNTFLSPIGNLYSSVLFKTSKKFNLNLLPLITSLSVKQSLEEYLTIIDKSNNLIFNLKWINDIYLSDAKISGVLCTSHFESDQIKLILSAGVNINKAPEIENRKITCLKESLKYQKNLVIKDYFDLYYNTLLRNLHLYIEEDNVEQLMNEIIDSLLYKNENVEIVDPVEENKILSSGLFTGIDENGNALIETKSLLKEKVSYGKMKQAQLCLNINNKI